MAGDEVNDLLTRSSNSTLLNDIDVVTFVLSRLSIKSNLTVEVALVTSSKILALFYAVFFSTAYFFIRVRSKETCFDLILGSVLTDYVVLW